MLEDARTFDRSRRKIKEDCNAMIESLVNQHALWGASINGKTWSAKIMLRHFRSALLSDP
jgi:hypothetical protein